MTTDNKTLADVQPGGRVRLGDQAAPSKDGWNVLARIDTAIGYLTTALDDLDSCPDRRPGIMVTEAMAVLRETLTAQPSPGGQGDAITPAMVDAAASALAKWAGHDDGSRWVHEARDALVAALAARQPVGLSLTLCRDSYPPLVTHSSSYGGIWTSDWCLVVDLKGSACSAQYQVSDFDKRSMDANGGVPNAVQNGPWRVPGFGHVVAWAKASDVVAHISRSTDAAPPAQAVDLGQFVPDPKTVPDCFAEDDSDAQYNSGWNDCRDAVLALIDGKAVPNG